MPITSEIAAELMDYLHDNLCIAPTLHIDSDLIAAGAIDSLIIMDLVRYVEKKYDIHCEAVDIHPRNFRSVRALSEFITLKASMGGAVAVSSAQSKAE